MIRFWLAALFVATTAAAAAAAPGEGQNSSPQVPLPNPDFLFGRPDGSLAIRGSWVFSRGGSDWYDFVTDQLTINRGSFNTPAIGFELGLAITPRLDILGGVDFNKSTTPSEYRDFVDNNRLPITQTTDLRGLNISGSLRYALVPRGREVGRLAWIPTSVVPYVGAGGGAFWFQLKQRGDFVDFVDLSVFGDVFQASGWTPSAHVFGGTDIQLYRRLFLSLEGRYIWAAGNMGAEWVDFDPIDLSGFRIGTGINVLF
jgi:opacity protein-like surface antigen